MKTIIINTTCNIGSTGKLAYSLHNALKMDGNESTLFYGVGKRHKDFDCIKIQSILEQKIHTLMSRITGLNGYFSNLATYKLIKKIKNKRPDIVYLGNLHGHYVNIYKLLNYLKEENILCIYIMWDEYPMTGSCSFSFDCDKYTVKCMQCRRTKEYPISWFFDTSTILFNKKQSTYKNFENIIFVSVPYTISKAKQSALLQKHRLVEADEGVDLDKIYYPRDITELREKLNIPKENKVILNVCVYPGERKGGKYYLEVARMCDDDKITFVHVGFKADISICPSNFIPIGFITDQNELAEYYSLADLFVCTSFSETQPNTCLEALGCGTPICGFNISGIPTCASEGFGTFVEPANVNELLRVIKATPNKTKERSIACREYALSRFSSELYNDKLIKLAKINLSKLIERN
jgi:putative colanic acid biosynthesis glycosyltransferase